MFCPKCGKEIESTSKFCKYCGTSVEQFSRNISQRGNAENTLSMQNKSSEGPPKKDATLTPEGFGALGVITSLIVKTIIILAIARMLVYVMDNLGMLGGTLVIFNSQSVSAGMMLTGFLEIGLATFVKKYPSGKIDRLFLLLPLIPVIVMAILIVLNLGTFFRSLGIVEGLFALAILDGGYYYCNMTYTVRLRKRILKEKMTEMSDEEIEELKDYATSPNEIDELKTELEEEMQREGK